MVSLIPLGSLWFSFVFFGFLLFSLVSKLSLVFLGFLKFSFVFLSSLQFSLVLPSSPAMHSHSGKSHCGLVHMLFLHASRVGSLVLGGMVTIILPDISFLTIMLAQCVIVFFNNSILLSSTLLTIASVAWHSRKPSSIQCHMYR